MYFDVSRLRRGELLAGGGAVVLAVSLFLLPWYGIKSPFAQTAATFHLPTTTDGWDGLEHLRWLVLVTILLGLALVWFQASSRTPAVPASLSVVLTVIGLINVLALVYRVVINVPGSDVVSQRAGAFVETVHLGPPATGPSSPAS
jgi:predicted signal transduction protein with EAL and GGDEF domain